MKSNTLPEGATLSSGTNNYRIVRVLGSGGFGITYLATSKRKLGNIPVTVNFAIKEHFMSDYCERDGATNRVVTGPGKQRETVENSKKDFIGEALRLQKIADGHPSIVKVNEVFEANGTAYYVMEYLDGQSLRRYVEENGPLNEWQTHSLLDPIAEAVDYLHSQRLTHLDIKPDNIMLTNDEDANGNPILRPVLIDFGLSKHYDASGRATSTINTLGCSDGYAPIEQYAGITTFSPSADIYALAATWLFCLTAHDPKKSMELFHENIDGQIAAILPPVSPQHRALLVAALSSDPGLRPFSLVGGPSAYNPQTAYAPQQAYIPQQAYAPQPSYSAPQGYVPQPGYPPHQGYVPQSGYAAPRAYTPQPAYPPQQLSAPVSAPVEPVSSTSAPTEYGTTVSYEDNAVNQSTSLPTPGRGDVIVARVIVVVLLAVVIGALLYAMSIV